MLKLLRDIGLIVLGLGIAVALVIAYARSVGENMPTTTTTSPPVAAATNQPPAKAPPPPIHAPRAKPRQTYPLHTQIVATFFYGGETASAANNWQTNEATAWCDVWTHCYGGRDDPLRRYHNDFWPSQFKPKENPFYAALPCSDFDENGLRADFIAIASQIPWVGKDTKGKPVLSQGSSVLKNHWIKFVHGTKTAYAQWEDTGPFENDTDNDCLYVFSRANRRPINKFGLKAGADLSPAVATALAVPTNSGSVTVSWQFVDATDVPSGPWIEIVTRSGPYWP